MSEPCYTIALIGNPNCGKTSLFNLLTGASQRTGNMAGVTVSGRFGERVHRGVRLRFVDLPGIYSLSQNRVEERVARDYLHDTPPDLVLNVLDAGHLGRHLALTSQLLEQGVPLLLALNMLDEAERNGARPNLEALSAALGVPVLPSDGRRRTYVDALFDALLQAVQTPRQPEPLQIDYESHIERLLKRLQQAGLERWQAVRWLESDGDVPFSCTAEQLAQAQQGLAEIVQRHDESPAELIAEGRYGWVHAIMHHIDLRHGTRNGLDERLDRLTLNRWLGLPLFMLALWAMFEATFVLGAVPAGWIDSGVGFISQGVAQLLPDSLLRDLLVDGIIAGVGGVLVFLPNVVLLFLFMELLEQTGYMARATFLVDRLMSSVGLHGKALVPLVMGFGCNVPAIMATRTIEEPRARLITILVNPFMSCSARLPVLLLLAGVFYPHYAGSVLFGIYLLGVLVALGCAAVLSRLLPSHYDETFIMELPPWRIPTLGALLLHLWDRSRDFLMKAGSVILIGSMLIWLLQSFPRDGISWIEQLGHLLAPLFSVLGFGWQETVALLSGFIAKEVIVATLAVVYQTSADDPQALQHAIGAALPAAAGLAMMVFTLLYMPCLATLAVIRRETGSWKWAGVSLAMGLSLAWIMAWLTFRIGSWLL